MLQAWKVDSMVQDAGGFEAFSLIVQRTVWSKVWDDGGRVAKVLSSLIGVMFESSHMQAELYRHGEARRQADSGAPALPSVKVSA